MVYLNETRPYRDNKAIACYYSYDQTCILDGVVSINKELIIREEHNFEKKDITVIGDYLKKFNTKIWVNKHDYFRDVLNNCYYLDFQDQQDCEQLSDLFRALLGCDRIKFQYEKQTNTYREKALPILVKALSYALFTSLKPTPYMALVGSPLKQISW